MRETASSIPATESFAVRVWLERVGPGKTEWRGRVEHMRTGETHYFREWSSLVDKIQSMLHSEQQLHK